MKKTLFYVICSLFVLFFTVGVTMAADENAADGELITRGLVEANEDGDAVAVINLTFGSRKGHQGAFSIKVDWDKRLANCYVRVRDLFLSGDSYVAAFGRRSGARVISATNQTTGGSPFASGVWSPYSVLYGKNTTIYVTPGRVTRGFAAGMQVEVNIPGKSFKYRVKAYQ